jgi:hypothetical protein
MTLDDVVSKVTDPYDRQARLYPALLALLPLFVLVTLLYGPSASALTGALTIAVSCGGLYLLTNLSRELGNRRQLRLYRDWGGKPTTQLLRHRDGTIEAVTKRRYHTFLAAKINVAFPDREEEESKPQVADETYQSGTRWLVDHTRPEDGKKFDLLFKQNIAYGFSRNALGTKPIGLVVSSGSLLWILAKENVISASSSKILDWAAFGRLPDAALASLTVSAAMLLVWLFFFTKSNLRATAFTYAETLLRTCDTLQ